MPHVRFVDVVWNDVRSRNERRSELRGGKNLCRSGSDGKSQWKESVFGLLHYLVWSLPNDDQHCVPAKSGG